MVFVDLQLFGSVEFPEPDPSPGGPAVVDDPPQPVNASARTTEAAKIAPRTRAKLRSLKLISVLTIGSREFDKIGSREEVREGLSKLCASLRWVQCRVWDLSVQQHRNRPRRTLRQQIMRRRATVDQPEVRALG